MNPKRIQFLIVCAATVVIATNLTNYPTYADSANAPKSNTPTMPTEFTEVFQSASLSKADIQNMTGKCYTPNPYIKTEDLRKVTVTYYGFDDVPHYGVLVVNKAVAEDILGIFEELYHAKYPIEKITPIEAYDGDDDLSMKDNNSSAFNYRKIAGTASLSNHAYGLAIDINPLINPYVRGNFISPAEGKAYANRKQEPKGMIHKDDVCYTAFVSRGWTWGGDWKSPKDYQHFEKPSGLSHK